jgi:hypothetical protein
MSDQGSVQVQEEQQVASQTTSSASPPQPTRTFNPNDHIIQLKSSQGPKDYLPVMWV